MTVKEFYKRINELYPTALSCSWDNDGIMISPDSEREIKKALISLDASVDAVSAALEMKADLLLTHHPIIFKGIRSLTDGSAMGKKIIGAVSNGLSVISLHTRLDAGDGGVNDCLCRSLGFEPSFKFGDDESPDIGRGADVPEMTGFALAKTVKEKLGCESIRLYGNAENKVRKIGFCGGDGKSFIAAAIAAGCDAYITGDAGYNASEDAADEGLIIIEAGHFHSENPVCDQLVRLVYDICGADTSVYDSCAYRVL